MPDSLQVLGIWHCTAQTNKVMVLLRLTWKRGTNSAYLSEFVVGVNETEQEKHLTCSLAHSKCLIDISCLQYQ